MIDNSQRPLGLFAAKGFNKGDIIGLYMGEYADSDYDDDEVILVNESDDVSDVSDLTRFMSLDPSKGQYKKLYMGAHFINDSQLITIQEDIKKSKRRGSKGRSTNVQIQDNYTVVCIKNIKCGHELLMEYFRPHEYSLVKKCEKNSSKKYK